ncbi:hypothetical protein BKA63DRAFT_291604 [Paraphoma chrysanthemicola]|nr:hypothetical protein BKA63DRAFT_291604 [Paraphoma chrysanthemicola]
MTIPHNLNVSPIAHISASSLPQTQAPASPAGSSQTPSRPTRPAPVTPTQNSDAISQSPPVRLSSSPSSISSASRRQSAHSISTTAAASTSTPNSPSSSTTPQTSSPSIHNALPNSTATPGASTSRKQQKLPLVFVEWRWELFTWALGTIAMSLILALLCIYKDRPLTSWKSKIQISAVVAIFSQVAQSALIVSVSATIGQAKWSTLTSKRPTIDVERYDEAMRGPEGSIKMLVAALASPRSPDNRRFRTHLALLAALVTVLMLSFGTFTQQAVAINVRHVENNSQDIGASSTVSRALSYRAEDSTPSQVRLAQPDGPFSTAYVELEPSFLNRGEFSVDTALSGAVLSGIATSHNFSDVAAQCATNDCRWPSYPTLAICSTVEDVSSQLVFTVAAPSPDEFVFYTEDVNMTLPIPELYDQEQGNPTFAGPTDFWMATLPAWRKGHNSAQPNLVAEVYVTFFSACRATNNNTGTPTDDELKTARIIKTNWRAFKSSFELCVQNLTTSIENGTTNTFVLERIDQQPWNSHGKDNATISYTGIGNNTTSSDRPPFSIDKISLQSLGDIMRLTLNGSATLRTKSDKKWESSEQIILAQDIYSGDPQICIPRSDNDIQGFGNRMQNIAVSLTNTLRRNSPGLERVRGLPFSEEQFIDVNSAWLALPVALWAIVTFLLAATIWRTVRLQLPSWKTSTLPWLECQVADNNLRMRSDMKESAEASYTQLKTSKSAWQLERTT